MKKIAQSLDITSSRAIYGLALISRKNAALDPVERIPSIFQTKSATFFENSVLRILLKTYITSMIVAKTSDTYVHTTMGHSKGTIDIPHNTVDSEAWISSRIGGISLQGCYGYTGQMVKTKNGRPCGTKTVHSF